MTPVEVEEQVDDLLARWQERDMRYVVAAALARRRRGAVAVGHPAEDMMPEPIAAIVTLRTCELAELRSKARAANVEDDLLRSEEWLELTQRLHAWEEWLA